MNPIRVLCSIMVYIFFVSCLEQKYIKPQLSDNELLEIRAYLVEKYDPGDCFGEPSVISGGEINFTINNHPRLAAFVQEKFDVSEAYDIFHYISKMQKVSLSSIESNQAQFSIKDGGCCIIVTTTGVVYVIQSEITHEELSSEFQIIAC